METIAEAFVAAGWVVKNAPASVEPGRVPFTAVKHVGGQAISQAGDTLELLLERCLSWDGAQAALKPEFRLGTVEVVRAAGRSDDDPFGVAA